MLLPLTLRAFPYVVTVHAGHGPAGGLDVLRDQRRYIENFRELVANHARDGKLTDEAQAAIHAETTRGRDGWPLDMLIKMNATAVSSEGLSA